MSDDDVPPEVQAVLRRMMGGADDGMVEEMKKEGRREEKEDPAITARKLLDVFAEQHPLYPPPVPFKPGDLVCGRPYTPYRFPLAKHVAIVMDVLSPPILDASEEGQASWDFRLPLDVVIGMFRGGRFMTFHQSSRFLQPYTGNVEPL